MAVAVVKMLQVQQVLQILAVVAVVAVIMELPVTGGAVQVVVVSLLLDIKIKKNIFSIHLRIPPSYLYYLIQTV